MELSNVSICKQIMPAWNILDRMLQNFPHSALLNRHVPTHIKGGVLDLTIVSSALLPLVNWTLHPYLTSDHYATTITDIPPLQKPPLEPRWNFRKANWHKFTSTMEEWAESYTPSNDLDTKEEEIVSALHHAANEAIPTSSVSSHTHRHKWYYTDTVRETHHLTESTQKVPLTYHTRKLSSSTETYLKRNPDRSHKLIT